MDGSDIIVAITAVQPEYPRTARTLNQSRMSSTLRIVYADDGALVTLIASLVWLLLIPDGNGRLHVWSRRRYFHIEEASIDCDATTSVHVIAVLDKIEVGLRCGGLTF